MGDLKRSSRRQIGEIDEIAFCRSSNEICAMDSHLKDPLLVFDRVKTIPRDHCFALKLADCMHHPLGHVPASLIAVLPQCYSSAVGWQCLKLREWGSFPEAGSQDDRDNSRDTLLVAPHCFG